MASKPIQFRRFLPLLGMVFFVAALWVLHRSLGDYHYQDILRQLKSISAPRVAMALVLTALSYLVMTGYDRLAVVYIGHPLERGRVSLASFISYAFSNNLGFSVLTSAPIRYRLYSAWGLSTEEIARVVTFTVVTFWLGIVAVGGVVFLAEPLAIPSFAHLPVATVRPLGFLFLAVVASYLLLIVLRRAPFRLRDWEFVLPAPRLALAQLLVGALDWALAGSVLYVLLPPGIQLSFFHFFGIYLLAQVVALISNIPGGLGVFESMILLCAPTVPADVLLGSLLVYRGIYYLLPLVMAALLLGGNEIFQKKIELALASRTVGRWISVLVPQILAAGTLVAGAVLLFSGATPSIPGRLHWLERFLPLPVLEISHFFGSLVGAGLLLLARGLQRRLDAAYLLTAILLGTGSLFSLLKGADYEEAAVLALMLAALLPCRRHFLRRASFFGESFTSGWILTILLVLASSVWLGIFSYKHVPYSSQLWWEFALRGEAPRFLRATVGVIVLLLLFALAKLLRSPQKVPVLPDDSELDKAAEVIARMSSTGGQLALLGDKELLFNTKETAFIMYGVEGRSWVAMGDPVGPEEEQQELVWRFRELCERQGGWPVFYQVGLDSLHLYLDLGLTLLKLGEEARVALPEFSLEGSARSGLRYIHRRLEKEGCVFEVLSAEEVSLLLSELQVISEAWLAEKNTREKGFSLGFFDSGYLCRYPLALVRQEGRIIAFADLWTGADREEISIDLMRFLPQSPKGVMDFLFVGLMLWGKAQGYGWFNLGMAPLAGLENRPFAPRWNRIGALIFAHGEHFYNFQGLREYKEKFEPVWKPRYLASPGGIALPRILANIAALISGGLKGVLGK